MFHRRALHGMTYVFPMWIVGHSLPHLRKYLCTTISALPTLEILEKQLGQSIIFL